MDKRCTRAVEDRRRWTLNNATTERAMASSTTSLRFSNEDSLLEDTATLKGDGGGVDPCVSHLFVIDSRLESSCLIDQVALLFDLRVK